MRSRVVMYNRRPRSEPDGDWSREMHVSFLTYRMGVGR